jgi:hypothetical protein
MIENDLQVLFRATNTFEQEAGFETRLGFQKNETVTGKVLRSHASGTALLSIKGEKVHVRTHVPLMEGTNVTLQVKNISPTTTLKFLGEAAPKLQSQSLPTILSAIKGNLWATTMDSILHSNLDKGEKTRILELLRTLTGSIYKKPSSDLLKTLISMSGLNLEAKIKKAINNNISTVDMLKLIENDLKGLLSKMIGQGMQGSNQYKKLWTALENIQVLNLDGLEQVRKIFFPIPMQLPDGIFSVAQLLLELPARDEDQTAEKNNNSDALKATFLLEMSLLGPIRAEFILQKKKVEGMFLVAEKQTKRILEENLLSLIHVLNDKGFSISHVGCFLKSPQTVTQPLLKEMGQEENSSICLIG